jgi:hypothetical protein
LKVEGAEGLESRVQGPRVLGKVEPPSLRCGAPRGETSNIRHPTSDIEYPKLFDALFQVR